MSNSQYYIGANDEHGVNPPTPGKRTPVLPGLGRQIYENEFNRAAKNKFIEACLRNDFRVFDVKPELRDTTVATRVARINRQNLTLLVTFGYNAFGSGLNFNSASGISVYYSRNNVYAASSRQLAEEIYESLTTGTSQRGRGVENLTDVGVLESVNCVSALAEPGFMTNLREAQLMIDPAFVTEVGEEAARGVCNYLGVPFIPRELSAYPTLSVGSRGTPVILLQFILGNYGYALEVDGVFGQETQNAVIRFQTENGLAADGVVGQNTWRTLLVLPPYPILRKGDKGAYVEYAQKKLESYLIPVGVIDGIFGDKTQNAVIRFQSENGLAADGIIGPLTWAELTKAR